MEEQEPAKVNKRLFLSSPCTDDGTQGLQPHDTNSKKPRRVIQPALGIEEAWKMLNLTPPREPRRKTPYARFKYLLTKEMKKVHGTKLTAAEVSNAWKQIWNTSGSAIIPTPSGEENQPYPNKQNPNYNLWMDCKSRADKEEKDQGSQFAVDVDVWKKSVTAGLEAFLLHILIAEEELSTKNVVNFRPGIEKAEQILLYIQPQARLRSLLAEAKTKIPVLENRLLNVLEDFLQRVLAVKDPVSAKNVITFREGVDKATKVLPHIHLAPERFVHLLEDAEQRICILENRLTTGVEAFLQSVVTTEDPASLDVPNLRSRVEKVADIIASLQAPARLMSLLVDAKQKLPVLEKRHWVWKQVQFYKTASEQELTQEAETKYQLIRDSEKLRTLQKESREHEQEEICNGAEMADSLKGNLLEFFQNSMVYDDSLHVRDEIVTYKLSGVTPFMFEKAFGPVEDRYETTLQSDKIDTNPTSSSTRLVYRGPIYISLKKGISGGNSNTLVAFGQLALQHQTCKDGDWEWKVAS